MTLPAPVMRVWRALVDPARLAGWLGADVTLDPRVGGRVALVDEQGERRGTVEAFEPCRHLVLRVWAPPTVGGPLLGSRIEFVLDDLGPSTRLTVTEHRVGAKPPHAGYGVQATQAGHGVQATQAGHGVQATQAGPPTMATRA